MPNIDKKIFFLGYYGFGNWGDELSLQSILVDFDHLSQHISFPLTYSVLVHDEDGCHHLPVDFHPVPRRNIFTVLSKITRADYLVVGGGSLLQDTTSLRSFMYYFLLLWWASIHHRPIIFYRCGLGPFRHPLSQRFVSLLLKKTSLFISRDRESSQLAIGLGCAPNRVFVGTDPVISNFSFLSRSSDEFQRIAFFVRNCDETKEKKLTEALDYLRIGSKCEIELVAFHREYDQSIATRMATTLGCQWKYFQTLPEVGSYFSHLNAIFTMRFHPAILATLIDIPWFAIDVDPKIASFSRWWNQKNLIDWNDLSQDTFLELYNHRQQVFKTNAKIKSHLIRLAEESQERLKQYFLKA